MKLGRPGIAVVTVALALAVPLGTGAAATSSGVQSTGSAHGIVLDAAGNPQADVCVGAYPLDEQGVAHGYTQSTADGSYTLAALAPGTYNVKIDGCFGGLAGPDIQQEYYLATSPNGTQTNRYTTLTIVSGANLSLATQRTRPAADIAIKIENSAGQVATGIYPAVVPVAPGTNVYAYGNTLVPDVNGYTRITNLLQGTYEIAYWYCGDPAPLVCRNGFIGYYQGM